MKKLLTLDKTYNFLKKPWVILLFFLITFFIYKYIDRLVALYFHQLHLRSTMQALNVLTTLGKWTIYVLLFSLAGLFFRFVNKNPKYEKNSWFLLACIVLPNLLGLILKVSLSRARPELLFSNNLYGLYWFKMDYLYWSLPSGHAITITALSAGLGVLLPRFYSLFLLIALLVATSRVLLYHHYLSDVLLGFYLSIMVVGVFTNYFKVTSSKKLS